jgi:hypothetical protein
MTLRIIGLFITLALIFLVAPLTSTAQSPIGESCETRE